jgi:glycopeptide antibiotics resistance protein
VRDLPVLMMAFTGVWIIIRIIAFVSRRKFSLKREIIVAAIPFASIFIYFVTLFPFPFFNPYQLVETGLERSHNLIPFKSIIESLNHFYYMVPIRNLGGNILLFVPFGFALLIRFSWMKLWKGTIIGLSISLFVEICQFYMGYRSLDVDDLILNTIGTFIGFAAFKGIVKISQKETFSFPKRKIG